MMKPIFLLVLWSLLTLHSFAVDEIFEDSVDDRLSLSLTTYQGVPKKQIFPLITQEFPEDELMRIGIIGGWTKSGLGQINSSYPLGRKPFYLINIDGCEVDCLLDWTTKELPMALFNQFHVLILEQIESDTLMSPMVYRNAFLALKPGGVVFFNTYRPSDFYIAYQNYLLSPEGCFLPPHLKELADNIDTYKGKAWAHLRKFFVKHLKDTGFAKFLFESGQSFDQSLFCKKSPIIESSECFRDGGYNSGGWAAGFKNPHV